MSYLGQFIVEIKAAAASAQGPLARKLRALVAIMPAAINEATLEGRNEAEKKFKVELTGTEGLSSEGLRDWKRLASEYGLIVTINTAGDAWGCRIVCPETETTGVNGHKDPESALRDCTAKWAAKYKAKRPHLAGLTIP